MTVSKTRELDVSMVPLAVADVWLTLLSDVTGEEDEEVFEGKRLAAVEDFVDESTVEESGLVYVNCEGEGSTGEELREYYRDCLQFWERLVSGEEPGPYVAVRRNVVEARQKDNSDLVTEAGELSSVPGVGAAVEELLSSEPDFERLEGVAESLGGGLSQSDDGETTMVFHLDSEAYPNWSPVLGGVRSPGEMGRELVVVARHAKWRDRKLRRLTRVEVWAHELWPLAGGEQD